MRTNICFWMLDFVITGIWANLHRRMSKKLPWSLMFANVLFNNSLQHLNPQTIKVNKSRIPKVRASSLQWRSVVFDYNRLQRVCSKRFGVHGVWPLVVAVGNLSLGSSRRCVERPFYGHPVWDSKAVRSGLWFECCEKQVRVRVKIRIEHILTNQSSAH